MSTQSMVSPDLLQSATFICGHPKSGTSLLAGLLDGHSQLLVYPEETGYFRRVLPAAEDLNRSERIDLAAQEILRIFQWNPIEPVPSQVGYEDRDYRDIDHTEVRREFEAISRPYAGSRSSLLPSAILAYGRVEGIQLGDVRRWVEKTPYNERFADQILSSWSRAKCLHIVRDPRDNYVSLRRKHPEWGPDAFAESWRDSASLASSNRQSHGPKRYFILRYEDLVTNLDEVLQEIVRFLGIRFEESLLQPTRRGRLWSGNSMFGEEFRTVSATPVGRWRVRLDAPTVRRIEGPSKAQMEAHGYAPAEKQTLQSRLRWLAYRAGTVRIRLMAGPANWMDRLKSFRLSL